MNNEHEGPEMDNVFRNIRNERQKRNLTLEQLANDTGLSKSFLSQVERGQAEPSVTSLKKIALRFRMSIVDLFAGFEPRDVPTSADAPTSPAPDSPPYVTDIKLVRADQRKKFTLPGSHIEYEMITPDLQRQMQILYLQFDPGESIGDDTISDPRGDKCFVVLRGSVQYNLGSDTYELHAGDSVYFPAQTPQSWRGIGDEHIEALVIMTPPWF